jgi:hypothetical protein
VQRFNKGLVRKEVEGFTVDSLLAKNLEDGFTFVEKPQSGIKYTIKVFYPDINALLEGSPTFKETLLRHQKIAVSKDLKNSFSFDEGSTKEALAIWVSIRQGGAIDKVQSGFELVKFKNTKAYKFDEFTDLIDKDESYNRFYRFISRFCKDNYNVEKNESDSMAQHLVRCNILLSRVVIGGIADSRDELKDFIYLHNPESKVPSYSFSPQTDYVHNIDKNTDCGKPLSNIMSIPNIDILNSALYGKFKNRPRIFSCDEMKELVSTVNSKIVSLDGDKRAIKLYTRGALPDDGKYRLFMGGSEVERLLYTSRLYNMMPEERCSDTAALAKEYLKPGFSPKDFYPIILLSVSSEKFRNSKLVLSEIFKISPSAATETIKNLPIDLPKSIAKIFRKSIFYSDKLNVRNEFYFKLEDSRHNQLCDNNEIVPRNIEYAAASMLRSLIFGKYNILYHPNGVESSADNKGNGSILSETLNIKYRYLGKNCADVLRYNHAEKYSDKVLRILNQYDWKLTEDHEVASQKSGDILARFTLKFEGDLFGPDGLTKYVAQSFSDRKPKIFDLKQQVYKELFEKVKSIGDDIFRQNQSERDTSQGAGGR